MKTNTDTSMPLVSHLVELRNRLRNAIIAVLACFCILVPFANDLYTFISAPLQKFLPAGSTMIATEVTSPFLTPFKFAMVVALFIAMPVVLFQLWAFVAPGLYQSEKRLAVPIFISSIVLFYAGAVFAYAAVFPIAFAFFTSVGPPGVTVMTDINQYLTFVLKLFFAFGIAFEIPVAAVIVVAAGLTTPSQLSRYRPYVIVSCFFFGMLLTPPDIISQTLLAVPMWLLFELGIVLAKFIKPSENIDGSD